MSADRPIEDLIVNNMINTIYYLRRLGKSSAQINELILLSLLRSVREIETLMPASPPQEIPRPK